MIQLHPYIQCYLPFVEQLCNEYNVDELYLIGSLATNKFNEKESDVDFMVKMPVNEGTQFKGKTFLNLYIALNELFKRNVDLLDSNHPISNPFLKKSIENTKIKIYDRKGTKVPG